MEKGRPEVLVVDGRVGLEPHAPPLQGGTGGGEVVDPEGDVADPALVGADLTGGVDRGARRAAAVGPPPPNVSPSSTATGVYPLGVGYAATSMGL